MSIVEPETRVCPRCGTPAAENKFCATCGLHLIEQPELPTRAEWEQRVDEPGQTPQPGVSSTAGSTPGPHVPSRTNDLATWFKRLSGQTRVALVVGLLLLVAIPVLVSSGDGDEDVSSGDASSDLVVPDPGPTAAEECVDRWNEGATDRARQLAGNYARNRSRDEVPTYVTVGYSTDVPDRCLITIAQPDLRSDGVAYQYRETAEGTFDIPSAHGAGLTSLPESVKQWNAQGDAQGNLTLGAP